jgi:hypothetical protein
VESPPLKNISPRAQFFLLYNPSWRNYLLQNPRGREHPANRVTSQEGQFPRHRPSITNKAIDQSVARIDRERFNAWEMLGNQQTYVVTCAAGVNMANYDNCNVHIRLSG